MSKHVVHLRVYKGNGRDAKLSYNEDGSVQNENILVKLTHNTLEWKNYLKHLRVNGFVKAVVEKVIDGDKEPIQKEIDKAMNPVEDKPLTPDQKRIAELEAKIDALSSGKKAEKPAAPAKTEPPADDELTALRVEYKEKVGKNPFHGWDAATLKEKMAEAK